MGRGAEGWFLVDEFAAEPVSAGELSLSAMVLGVSFQKNFLPRLQFVKEPTAAGQCEIFGVAPERGCCPSQWSSRPARTVPRWCACPARSPRRQTSSAVVPPESYPVANLAPGDYILRGVLSLNGAPIGTVTRVLREAQ